MKARIWLLAATLLAGGIAPQTAWAQWVHNLDCNTACHKPTAQINSLNNTVCISCHVEAKLGTTVLQKDGSTSSTITTAFAPGDASNAMGTNPTPGLKAETSHHWGAPKDAVPASGAKAPVNRLFYGRYGISSGKVTCSRCHDPHGDKATNPKLLKLGPGSESAMCLDCHSPWNKGSADRGLLSHPIVPDYAAVANGNPNYNYPMVASGDMQLVAGGVSCLTCHGIHYSDSDATTTDGKGNQAVVNANGGDGKMLRSDGPLRTGATEAETAQLRSNLCQACHTYARHGIGKTHPIGCLDCHSGHSYNKDAPTQPNYYVLRPLKNSSSVYLPKTGSLNATALSLNYKTLTAEWANGGGSGYCQQCHNLPLPHNGLSSGGKAECASCHVHSAAGGSFAANCTSCHGYPPSQNVAGGTPNSGFAYVAGTRDYRNAPNWKDESQTAHLRHAGPGEYKIACDRCHAGVFAGNKHNDNNFQDVYFDAFSGNGGLTPAYDPAGNAGNGQCSNIYCHSNGGARTGDATRNTVAATIPAWEAGSTGCASCHGNDAATMSGKNSAAHIKHLNKGYACNVCHEGTAVSATTLVASAVGGIHVDGNRDVSFDTDYDLGAAAMGGGAYGNSNGTCSVYCHSDGKGNKSTPDWDSASTGACGTCHGARPGDPAVIASGSHARHVSDVNGPRLACNACHPANSQNGTHATHVDGTVNVDSAVCNGCHAVDAGETVPVWGSAATATCDSCHSGATVSVIGGKTAPAKSLFRTKGHGLPSGSYPVSNRPAANRACTACHNADAPGHFDGTSGDDLRMHEGGAFPASYTADKKDFCAVCHGTLQHHQTKQCIACHDPHGTPNITMVYRSQATQNAKDDSGTGEFSGDVVFLAFTGADSFDEGDGGVAGANGDDICATCHTATTHNNRANAAGDHNSGDKRGTNCLTCHQHAKAFRPVGNACNDCHGNGTSIAPTTGAHAVHTRFITADKNAGTFDVSECDLCHSGVLDGGGALRYSYDLGADNDGGVYHSDGTNRINELVASMGYNATDKTCSNACHKSTVGDGAWNDGNGLNCDACHYHAASPTSTGNNAQSAPYRLSNAHNKHFDKSYGCGTCHGTLDPQGKGPLPHKHAKNSSTNALWLQTQGKGYLNPGGTDVNVAVPTWTNSAVTNDAGNSCGNAQCHNPSPGASFSADWDGTNSKACYFCHGYNGFDAFAPDITSGSHNPHLKGHLTYGKGIACSDCHGSDVSHPNGSVNIKGTITYTGNTADYGSGSWGGCGTNVCHQNGRGGAPVVTAYTWGETTLSGCGFCHSATPATDDHTVHLSGTYGPLIGTNCGACHRANANNTSMAGQTLHMSGNITFRNAAGTSWYEVATGQIGAAANDPVDTCNACHGGATPALVAKDYWKTASRVSCGSCHGDYSAASIGVAAPLTAGTNYSSFGHGKTGVAQGCTACHSDTAAHISGSLGDAKRLKVIGGKDFGADPNGYCGACHDGGTGNEKAHYASTGGTGISGTSCVTCHTPHGARDKNNNGLDAMMKRTVGASEVVGFADKTARGSYFRSTPNATDGYGICQVCHDPSKVNFFNQTTASDATHNPGTLCTACHTHSNSTAFKATCNTCHGNEAAGNYWPDGTTGTYTIAAANDEPGRHAKHVEVLAQKLYGQTTAQLLADAATETKQKTICSYCHATPGSDADHGLAANLPADTSFHPIWNLGAADAGSAYTRATGNCASIDCHNNKDTGTTTYGWKNAGTTACIMCHADVTATGTPTGDTHRAHASDFASAGNRAIGCSTCHHSATAWGDPGTKPGANHLDGTFNVGGSVTLTYTGTYPSTKGSCGTNLCHNNGKNGAPLSAYTWGTALPNQCNICHGGYDTEAHVAHGTNAINVFTSTAIDCQNCHATPFASTHFDGTVTVKAAMNYTGNTSVASGSSNFGTCTTTTCHQNGQGTAVTTPAWNRTPSSADNCSLCHANVPATGSHVKHVKADHVPTAYGQTGNVSTAADYIFRCGECHGTNFASHLNGTKNVTVTNWNSGAKTCGQNGCHQNGAGGAPQQTVTWGTAPAGDPCAICHGNAPTTNAHAAHEVGFHYNAIYSGTTGFLPVTDSDPIPAGLTGTRDELRGHGGNVGGASTSTVLSCQICHNATVTVWYNAKNSVCDTCHNAVANPSNADKLAGNAAAEIADKTKHLNGVKDILFVDQKLRSKGQVRDSLSDVPELGNNWTRVNGYKAANGSSYDETPGTLRATGTWTPADKSCTVACHLWEAGRVDKVAPTWNGGAIMCIDCHSRLPK